MTKTIEGINIPDSKLAREVTELVRDTESPLLFHHSSRVHKPETTFGNVKADVLADKDPAFRRGNFCSVIRGSAWPA